MKKVTNQFRRCAHCPHHQPPKKCCCQRVSQPQRNRAVTSRPKREPSTIEHSSAQNTSIPTIIAQFSTLRNQNQHLKRQLLNVSTFLKEESQTMPAQDQSLSQKLFFSNKNLKEALLQVDELSKANKELCDRNSRLQEQSEGLSLQLKEAEDLSERYRRKCRNMTKQKQSCISKGDIEVMAQRNAQLQQQVATLKDELRCLRFQNNNLNMVGGLSPEWVAHTGNKIKVSDVGARVEDEISKGEVQLWKRSLSDTINLLKTEGSHLSSTPLVASNLSGFWQLIEQLIQSYSESMLFHFQLLMKQMNRKLNNYEKKMDNVASKLQNFIIVFKNKRLKRKLVHPFTSAKTERMPMADLTNRVM